MQPSTQAVRGTRSSLRCAQMVQCLREGFVYTEKKVRDLLFTVYADIVEDRAKLRSPWMLSRLTREAAECGRRAGEPAGVCASNWHTASRAVGNAMLGAGVLLDEGAMAIGTGIAARASRILALREDFRDRTEAYLVEFLLRKLGDVGIHDHVALAHALFRQFDPNVPMGDMEDRVIMLLASLEGRIALDANGIYTVLDL